MTSQAKTTDTLQEWDRRTKAIAEALEIPQAQVMDRMLNLMEWSIDPTNNANPEITTALHRENLGESQVKRLVRGLTKLAQ